MGNRSIRKAIQGLQRQIRHHLDKIEQEKQRDYPNWDVIAYWESEIETFQTRLHRLEARLARRRRRGR